jgi:hypothetical protein
MNICESVDESFVVLFRSRPLSLLNLPKDDCWSTDVGEPDEEQNWWH